MIRRLEELGLDTTVFRIQDIVKGAGYQIHNIQSLNRIFMKNSSGPRMDRNLNIELYILISVKSNENKLS